MILMVSCLMAKECRVPSAASQQCSQVKVNLAQFMNDFISHIFLKALTTSTLMCLLDSHQHYCCCCQETKNGDEGIKTIYKKES